MIFVIRFSRLLRRERGDDLLETRIATQRVEQEFDGILSSMSVSIEGSISQMATGWQVWSHGCDATQTVARKT